MGASGLFGGCPLWVKSRHVQRRIYVRFVPIADIEGSKLDDCRSRPSKCRARPRTRDTDSLVYSFKLYVWVDSPSAVPISSSLNQCQMSKAAITFAMLVAALLVSSAPAFAKVGNGTGVGKPPGYTGHGGGGAGVGKPSVESQPKS